MNWFRLMLYYTTFYEITHRPLHIRILYHWFFFSLLFSLFLNIIFKLLMTQVIFSNMSMFRVVYKWNNLGIMLKFFFNHKMYYFFNQRWSFFFFQLIPLFPSLSSTSSKHIALSIATNKQHCDITITITTATSKETN